MGLHNTLAQQEGNGVLFTAGRINVSNVTATLISVGSPLSMAADTTISRTSPGLYVVTINPFKGPQGFAVPSVSASSTSLAAGASFSGLSAAASLPVYTNESCVFSIAVNSGNTAVDADVFYQIFAF